MQQPTLPVTKAGGILVRGIETALPQILIVRANGKQGDVPPYVLPRGTRAFPGPDGELIDARDAETAIRMADVLEPIENTACRELTEEAGLAREQFYQSRRIDMGALPFHSRSKGIYPVHWFAVALEPRVASALLQQPAKDSSDRRWASLSEIEGMAERGEFSKGYLPIIKEALAQLQRQTQQAI